MSDALSPKPAIPWNAILLGGFIAATNDIVYACISLAARAEKSVQWTLQSVAAGWLGEGSFTSGWPGAMLGLGSHYFILFVAAFIYWAASRRLAFLRSQAVACGVLFGIGVYLFMNFVVVPLSAFPYHIKYTALKVLEGFATHGLFVGVPIALCIRRFSPP